MACNICHQFFDPTKVGQYNSSFDFEKISNVCSHYLSPEVFSHKNFDWESCKTIKLIPFCPDCTQFLKSLSVRHEQTEIIKSSTIKVLLDFELAKYELTVNKQRNVNSPIINSWISNPEMPTFKLSPLKLSKENSYNIDLKTSAVEFEISDVSEEKCDSSLAFPNKEMNTLQAEISCSLQISKVDNDVTQNKANTIRLEKEKNTIPCGNEIFDSPDVGETVLQCPTFDCPPSPPNSKLQCNAKNIWKCLTCSQVFPTDQILKKHFKKNHINKKLFRCNKCPKWFQELNLYNIHMKHHLAKIITEKDSSFEPKFDCKPQNVKDDDIDVWSHIRVKDYKSCLEMAMIHVLETGCSQASADRLFNVNPSTLSYTIGRKLRTMDEIYEYTDTKQMDTNEDEMQKATETDPKKDPNIKKAASQIPDNSKKDLANVPGKANIIAAATARFNLERSD